MERIQSAIKKAREARADQPLVEDLAEDQEAVKAAKQQPVEEVEQPPMADVLDRWLILEEMSLKPRLLKNNRILTSEGGAEAAPFDMLRTRVLQQMRTNNWRRLAITSPTSGCGKTTTSCNLAFSLARQADLRTVVIETDMRRPALAKVLGQKRSKHQFAKVLAGTAAPQEHMFRYGSNLCFGTNHAPQLNSSELLQSATTKSALENVEKTLDPEIMIFDTAPLLASDDTVGFLEQVDCVLLVAEAESTTIEEIDTCERDLAAHTNVLGVVLNKCRYAGKGYGYNYGY